MKELSVSLNRSEKIAGWSYYVFQLLFLGTILVSINYLLGGPLSIALVNVVMFFINFAAIALIFHKFLWQNLRIALRRPGRTLGIMVCGYVLYYICSFVVGLIIVLVKPDFANANDSNVSDMLRDHYFLMSLGTVWLVPVVEETLYRGLLFGTVYRFNKVLGYAVSMLAFALVHIVGYIGIYDPVSLVLSLLQYLPAGFFLAWVYVHTDSIWGSILMHMLINQLGILVMR